MNNSLKPGVKLIRVTETKDWHSPQKGSVNEIRYIMDNGTIVTISANVIYPEELHNYVPDYVLNSPLYDSLEEDE